MTAAKKAYNKKVLKETEGMTQKDKQNYMFVEEMVQKFEKLARELEFELFPEIYDMQGDSISDANMRRQGKSPMNAEYTEKVNEKRRRLGFLPLGENGLPVDSALQYCKDLIIGTRKYAPEKVAKKS